MDAFASMANQLQAAPEFEVDPPENDSKAGRMRQELRDNGPQTARRLAEVAGVANSGMVGALLKHDLHRERVVYSDGYYRWNPDFVPKRAGAESVTWHPVAEGLPDADLTVLIACDTEFHSEPVWIGFHDGEAWREANGEPAFVTHWAQLPPSPDALQAMCKCIFCARDILDGGECQSEAQAEKCDRLAAGVGGTDGR